MTKSSPELGFFPNMAFGSVALLVLMSFSQLGEPLKPLLIDIEQRDGPSRVLSLTAKETKSSRPSYHELKDEIHREKQKLKYTQKKKSMSAYSRATLVTESTPWFPKRRQCKETCCVETVAISRDQDVHKIANAEDGRDVADLMIDAPTNSRPLHLNYHAGQTAIVSEDLMPCMLPGTVIYVQNHMFSIRHWWHTLRPKMQVPYVLIMAGGDGHTPAQSTQYMTDPLLIKLYGINPQYPDFEQRPALREPMNKYQSFPLGLSTQHPQERHMLPYLSLTNFSNPFSKENFNTARWQQPLDLKRDVFVHFGLHRPIRRTIWNILCDHATTTSSTNASCNNNTRSYPLHDMYADMSRYRFEISPRGYGYDCYRTYEMLLLGIIPVIEEKDPEGYQLFEGLPVVHMPNLQKVSSQQQFVDAIEGYIQSDAFQKADFEEGWKRLFLQSFRQDILKASGRDKDVLRDPSTGREYYQALHYSIRDPNAKSTTKYVGTNGNVDYCAGLDRKQCRQMSAKPEWLHRPQEFEGPTDEDVTWLAYWTNQAA